MVGSLAPFALARGRLRDVVALAVLCGATTLGCGGRSHSAPGMPATGSDDTGSGGSGAAGGVSGGGAGMSAAGAATVDYAGVVLASVVSDGAAKTYSAFAAFSEGAGVNLAACSTCCCYHQIGLSLPRPPPNAATIELTTTEDNRRLASLVPSADSLHGSWVVGSWGIVGASDYAAVVSEPWSPHQTLRVSAQGNQVHAFSGEVRTGAGFAGLSPEIAGKSVAVDRDRDFTLTWMPEDGDDEWVTLFLQRFGDGEDGFCICSAPDSTGSLTLSVDEVAKFSVGNGSINLMRSIAAPAPNDNASVTLVSQVGMTAPVDFR